MVDGWDYDFKSVKNVQSVPKMIMGNRIYDVQSLLLKNRIIQLSGEVDHNSSNYIISMLLALDVTETDNSKDITLYINSPGGSVTEGLAIYDTMQHIKSDVSSVCIGIAASMASVLLMAGKEGKRYALPHSTIMVHQLSHGLKGSLKDTKTGVRHVESLEDMLLNIYVKHVPKDEESCITQWGGKTNAESFDDIKPTRMKPDEAKEWLREWASYCDRYMSAEQALKFGHIDKIIK